MEYYAELMQRLLEIQSGGRQRNTKLAAEDHRSIAALQKKVRAEKPPHLVEHSQDSSEQMRFKA
jgi:hypothetical protein